MAPTTLPPAERPRVTPPWPRSPSCRTRNPHNMARQCLEANSWGQHAELVGKVHLLDRRLQAVGVQGELAPPDAVLALEQRRQQQHAAAGVPQAEGQQGSSHGVRDEELEEVATLLPERASVLVTDLFDHSVLGVGLLPALNYAAERLLAPGALVVPQRVQVRMGDCKNVGCYSSTFPFGSLLPAGYPQVYAVLLELRVGEVCGFDLSTLNSYWWHPGTERLDLSRLPYRRLSACFPVHMLDLQSRLDARLREGQGNSGSSSDGHGAGGKSSPGHGDAAATAWELDSTLEVSVTADGQWNAIAFWFDLHTHAQGDGAVISSWTDAGDKGQGHNCAAGAAGVAALPTQLATSWDPAVQYVDSQMLHRGATVQLRVRQDSGQYVFTTRPPQCRPRHALGEHSAAACARSCRSCKAADQLGFLRRITMLDRYLSGRPENVVKRG